MSVQKRKIKRCCYAILSALILPFLISLSVPTARADNALGEINIRLSGTVVALGCTVEPGDVNKQVNLGSWATKQLKKPGDRTKAVGFTIRLTGCTASGVTTAFTGNKDSADSSLLALSEDSSAEGVAIQIMDETQKRIPMGDDAPRTAVDSNGNAALKFYASYVATRDSISAGTANADTEFTLTYD